MDNVKYDTDLEKVINKYSSKDLDVSSMDFSDIEYVKSDNFITRGSIFKNSGFNDKAVKEVQNSKD